MVRSLKDYGRMALRMGSEYGNLLKEIFMKVNGVSIANTERVFISIEWVLIVATSLISWRMERAKRFLPMVIDTSDFTKLESLMGKVSIFGLMEALLKAVSWRESEKALEYGDIVMGLYMKASFRMISKMERVHNAISLDKCLKAYSNKARSMKEHFMTWIRTLSELHSKYDFLSFYKWLNTKYQLYPLNNIITSNSYAFLRLPHGLLSLFQDFLNVFKQPICMHIFFHFLYWLFSNIV